MKIDVNIPDGVSGEWEVSTFTISEEMAENYNFQQMMYLGSRYRPVYPGTYKRLTKNGAIVMSNTPAEILDHKEFIYVAQTTGGSILVNGLGLGMAISKILESDKVAEVTVIEISEDVIKLVGPYITDKRVTIIQADALTWKAPKGKRYDVVWHDIWNEIDTRNSKTMGILHRKYGKRSDWQWSWGRKEMKAMMRE